MDDLSSNVDGLVNAGGIFGILLFVFLAILAIAWILLPFAIFGIKERIDKMTKCLSVLSELEFLSEKMDKMAILLDPDGEKITIHEQHVRRKAAEAAANEDRIKKAEKDAENERLERLKAMREERKMAKKKASGSCPSCGKPIEITDLRPGVTHECPHCHGRFQVS